MAINVINSTGGGDFKFLINQSSILLNSDTNDVTVNGVNVIVDKPKKGDIMCVTRYKDEANKFLPADEQKVVWVDGLSINPDQLSSYIDPVGICLNVDGNKAMVRYKYERTNRYETSKQFRSTNEIFMKDGLTHSLSFFIDGKEFSTYTFYIAGCTSNYEFSQQFDNYLTYYNPDPSSYVKCFNLLLGEDKITTSEYSESRVVIDFGVPVFGTYDVDSCYLIDYDGYHQIYYYFEEEPIYAYKYVHHENLYTNNGFSSGYDGGSILCKQMYLDFVKEQNTYPTKVVTTVQGSGLSYNGCVKAYCKDAFENSTYCQILRDTFATYDEYIDSFMLKWPCGKGGDSQEFPSGKFNTQNIDSERIYYRPAIETAKYTGVNGPKLTRGNWWIPSIIEIGQIMKDITYGTSAWEDDPDIINTVLNKVRKSRKCSDWDMLPANTSRWTSDISYYGNDLFYYDGETGSISSTYWIYNPNNVNACKSLLHTPLITIYEL